MNDQGEKQDPAANDGADQSQGDIAQPVAGDPANDATELASADSSAMEIAAGDKVEEVVDTSADESAAREALDDAEQVIQIATGTEEPDVLETPASDETLPEEELDAEFEEEEPVEVAPAGPIELDVPEAEDVKLEWYILKVQSNRERSIADALRRKIAIEGLDDYFGQVLVPTEKVTEFKGGKKKVVERKLWPGYIAVEMHVNDDTWFAIRETSGIGDFTGSAGKPTPMQPNEIAMILHTEEEETEEAPKLDIKFTPGDKVKVMEGNFENFEGEVSSIEETHGRVTVMLSIFGRPTPVELEYWQVEAL